MRKLRNFSIILFIISAALFAFFRFRELSLQDRSGPEIAVNDALVYVSIHDPESKLLEGITAVDRKDGDVTDTLVVENVSTFLRPGTRVVRYAAFDKDMHVSRTERELIYTDYSAPEYSITKPLVFAPGNSKLLDSVSVTDCLDGDLSDSIKILSDNELLVDVPGDYPARLQASNSAGDVAVLPVIISIKENLGSIPQIRLDNYVKYLDPGEEFDPYSLITRVSIGNTFYEVVEGEGTYGDDERDRSVPAVVGTDQIDVRNPVDPSKPGNYTVTYSMTIPVGNYGDEATGETNLYVVVRDTPAP
ncbi:MAG: hypothetical protein IKF90_02495 [Parasporobacterium sp.]|nr:hypothetical protein [Parasporobacterium sp.]